MQQSKASRLSKREQKANSHFRFEATALANARTALEALTDDKEQFMSDCLTKYKEEVKVFKPENYGL